jgi:VWFA-related protein
MRLTSIAAGVLMMGLAAYVAASAGLPATGATPRSRAAVPQNPQQQQQQSQQQQSQQPPPQVQGTIKSSVLLVNVFVTVRDKRNGVIGDLTKDDFKILEEGKEQQIAFFSRETDMPITLGILMDTSGSMGNIMGAEQDAASRFLKEVLRPRDLAMVMSFDFDVDLLADFTQDTAVLERAIRRARVNAVSNVGMINPGTVPAGAGSGGTNLYDAVYLAAHDQLTGEAGRKAVILLTDAEDTGSKLGVKDAIESAQRSDAVIHVLLIQDPGATQGYGGGIARKMTEETGGRVIPVHNERTLEKAFDEISQELRSQYVLGYYPINNNRDGTFRKIQVQIDKPDLKILARKGYYAPRQ